MPPVARQHSGPSCLRLAGRSGADAPASTPKPLTSTGKARLAFMLWFRHAVPPSGFPTRRCRNAAVPFLGVQCDPHRAVPPSFRPCPTRLFAVAPQSCAPAVAGFDTGSDSARAPGPPIRNPTRRPRKRQAQDRIAAKPFTRTTSQEARFLKVRDNRPRVSITGHGCVNLWIFRTGGQSTYGRAAAFARQIFPGNITQYFNM